MQFHTASQTIINELSDTLKAIDAQQIESLKTEILQARKVFFVGVGRVLLSLEAIAKRLAHLGIDTVLVGQITEPAITSDDFLIIGSGSGESGFPLHIAKKAKSFQARIAHIGSNQSSSMQAYSDIFVQIPVQTKLGLANETPSVQPMTSLFEQTLLLVGDAIAMLIIEEEDLDMKDLWNYHANLE